LYPTELNFPISAYPNTDVEIIRPLDEFLHHNAFLGFQTPFEIQTGLIACQPRNSWIGRILMSYDDKKFINIDGSYDMVANVALITNISKNLGFEEGNEFHVFNDGIAVYPIDYFCAKDYRTGKIYKTENTYAIHHFSGSWLPWSEKIKSRIRKIMGLRLYGYAKSLIKN